MGTCIYFQQLSNTVPTQLYDMNTLRLPLFRFGAFRRFTTSHPTNGATSDVAKSMSAWQINDYGGIDALELVNDIPVPPLSQPDDVLIEVKAASVNVLDVMMTDGYGRQLFEKFHSLNPLTPAMLKRSYFPLTLGRDFSGIVRSTGGNVVKVKPGDHVMGVVPPPLSGSHSQYLVSSCSNIVLKPPHLSMEEATSIPYAGLTAWSALSITAELCVGSRGKQVLVLGASGGVGSIAVQLLKSWGSSVVATCSSDAVPLLENLGCDFVIDYTSADSEVMLEGLGGFDVVLDCTGRSEGFNLNLLKSWANAKYVTLSPPTLNNFDNNGLLGGILKTGMDLMSNNTSALMEGKTMRWGFFMPNPCALKKMSSLANDSKLKGVIDSTYSYECLPDAYAKLKAGHARGKVIIQMP